MTSFCVDVSPGNVLQRFLERSAEMPLRICVTQRCDHGWPEMYLMNLWKLFPLHRVRQISIWAQAPEGASLYGQNLLSVLDLTLDHISIDLTQFPSLELFDLSVNTHRRLARVVHRFGVGYPKPKPIRLEVDGDNKDLWRRISQRGLEELTRLTLSNVDMAYSGASSAFVTMGVSLTYFDVANISPLYLPWGAILEALPKLRWLRIEQTKPVYQLTTIVTSELEQTRNLQKSLIDILPTLSTSLRQLQGIELITNLAMNANRLIDFIRLYHSGPHGENIGFQVVVSRPTFVDSEIGALRELANVRVV